jgi:Concanavalin A-like lectin/glucanases superfamily
MRRRLLLACAAGLLGGCTAAPIEVATVGTGALTDGLLAHWALDEGRYASAADTSGNGHNGVLQGPGWQWVGGKFGNAVHFSGVDLISVTPFPAALTNYTVSAWVYIASSEVGPPIANLVSTEVLGGGWALFATLSTGPGAAPQTFAFEYADSTNPSLPLIMASCTCVVTDQWVHLAAVLDGDAGTLTIYAGTAPPVTVPAPAPIVPGSASLDIGHSTRQELGSAFPVIGAIDDVAIYGRALSADEVTQLGVRHAPDPN